MSSVRDLIEVLMNASLSRGQTTPEEASAAAKKLLIESTNGTSNVLKADEVLPLFDILPRSVLPNDVLLSLLPRFFEAEKQLGRNDASSSLVTSGFAGFEPHTGKQFVEAANTALRRVPFKDGAASEALSASCLKWSLSVLEEANKNDMADVVAARANAIVAQTIRSSSFFFFASVVDALRAVKPKLLPEPVKAVIDGLMEPVLVQAAGLGAYSDFQSKGGSKHLEGIFASSGVDFDGSQLLRKVRMISLTRVLAGKSGSTCTISEIAAGLGLKAGDKQELDVAENTVIDAATANLVAVRIDRNSGAVQVVDIAVLRFDAAAWKALKKRVDDFTTITDKVAKQYDLPAVN